MKKISFLYPVFLLLMLGIPFQTAADDFVRGDVDQDGKVGISDVTTLVDYLLAGVWPGDEPVESPTTESFTVNGVTFKMVKVEGGTFTMGATPEQGSSAATNEKPAHQVMLSDYSIGETEVTQELWRAVMGTNPSTFTASHGYYNNFQRPVETISWNDCQAFISKLNDLTGRNFRLPTEAEWEFAARGGNQSKGYKYAGSNEVGDVAWYKVNAYDMGSTSFEYGTHAVATREPNELGLYDMSGNVWEWVNDWYGDYANAQVNPTGPATGNSRVQRGGSWCDNASSCRVSRRQGNASGYTGNNVSSLPQSYFGLRLAL